MSDQDAVNKRRMYIDDEQWERTSPSWKELLPLRDFDQWSETNETPEQMAERLGHAGFSIPLPVIAQWLYPHYYTSETVDNYGWLDYRRISFSTATISVSDVKQLHVIHGYREYVQTRASSKPYGDFVCKPEDLAYWQSHGTWRVPPIVLDVESLPTIPSHAEILGPLQLVEGHSRLGYLLALDAAGMLTVQDHTVFMMVYEE